MMNKFMFIEEKAVGYLIMKYFNSNREFLEKFLDTSVWIMDFLSYDRIIVMDEEARAAAIDKWAEFHKPNRDVDTVIIVCDCQPYNISVRQTQRALDIIDRMIRNIPVRKDIRIRYFDDQYKPIGDGRRKYRIQHTSYKRGTLVNRFDASDKVTEYLRSGKDFSAVVKSGDVTLYTFKNKDLRSYNTLTMSTTPDFATFSLEV